MSQTSGPTDVTPFGGDDLTYLDWRPNPCYACGRSMSEKWGRTLCAFCVGDDDE